MDRVPEKSEEWEWSDFKGLPMERYSSRAISDPSFFYYVASAIASQCADWDEQTRWNLIRVFEKKFPGETKKRFLVPLKAFAFHGFLKEAEIRSRIRDIVTEFPGSGGSNYPVVAFLGRSLDAPELIRFAQEGAVAHFQENPRLKGEMERVLNSASTGKRK